MSDTVQFDRLIRFVDDHGNEHFGNVEMQTDINEIVSQSVELLKGSIESGFVRTGTSEVVRKLLCPLPEAPIIPCVGLNYQHHATEAKVASIPKHPVVFSKPSTALAGPYEDVHVHPEVQKMVDYEGELTVVIGRAAKNVQAEDALDYVLGFTAGNDVSARDYQGPIEVSGGQFSYAKSFDTFAPIGPCITSTKLIPDPQALNYVTRVNGEIRQQTSTSDMIWSVKQIIEHLSRGTTLLPGTCIMTGTPSGVGVWMVPPKFLKHGDVVEVEIEKIGMIRNKMVFG